jgi:hypothetical protein
MPGNKYLALIAGKLKEVFAIQTSAGAADAGKIIALDSTGRVDPTMMPVGIGAEAITATATEALTAGNFVNVYNNAGAIGVRKADATTNAKPANGFVLIGVANAAVATVYLISQTNTALTGLTAGAEYWLSTTPGGVITTAPAAAGNLVQFLGFAASATSLVFENTITIEVG